MIRRKAPGQYVNGYWQEGAGELFQIKASVQPMRGTEMEMLPEGRRQSQAVKLYTNTQLQTVDDSNPDTLQAFGSSYEVLSVEPWQSNVLSHYKVTAVRVGPLDFGSFQRTADGGDRITANGFKRIIAN
jgi:hypothetical protein